MAGEHEKVASRAVLQLPQPHAQQRGHQAREKHLKAACMTVCGVLTCRERGRSVECRQVQLLQQAPCAAAGILLINVHRIPRVHVARHRTARHQRQTVCAERHCLTHRGGIALRVGRDQLGERSGTVRPSRRCPCSGRSSATVGGHASGEGRISYQAGVEREEGRSGARMRCAHHHEQQQRRPHSRAGTSRVHAHTRTRREHGEVREWGEAHASRATDVQSKCWK